MQRLLLRLNVPMTTLKLLIGHQIKSCLFYPSHCRSTFPEFVHLTQYNKRKVQFVQISKKWPNNLRSVFKIIAQRYQKYITKYYNRGKGLLLIEVIVFIKLLVPKRAVWLFVCSWSYLVSALPFLYSAELQPLVVSVRNFVRICGTQSLKVVYCYPVPAVQIYPPH